jgi:hypothetical protein
VVEMLVLSDNRDGTAAAAADCGGVASRQIQ